MPAAGAARASNLGDALFDDDDDDAPAAAPPALPALPAIVAFATHAAEDGVSRVGGGSGDSSGSTSCASAVAPTPAASAAEPPEQQLLALPAPAEEGSAAITLDCSTGEAVTLDHLGPVVVNSDTTLSRIANWDEMSDKEQAVAKRRIAKRNIERLRGFQGEIGQNAMSALASGIDINAVPDARGA